MQNEIEKVSDAQLTANQQNALKSTGPKTKDGKVTASKNATRHGIFSTAPIIKGETKEQWESFLQAFLDTHEPVGIHEMALVHRIAYIHWRLLRVLRHENAVVNDPSFDMEKIVLQSSGIALPSEQDLASIVRYETHLHRLLTSTMHELERMQIRRLGGTVQAPMVYDVTVDSPERSE
jgi:hypothetical protein